MFHHILTNCSELQLIPNVFNYLVLSTACKLSSFLSLFYFKFFNHPKMLIHSNIPVFSFSSIPFFLSFFLYFQYLKHSLLPKCLHYCVIFSTNHLIFFGGSIFCRHTIIAHFIFPIIHFVKPFLFETAIHSLNMLLYSYVVYFRPECLKFYL